MDALQAELAAFKDPELARGLVEAIAELAPDGGATLMEVCGTHTVSIARNGIRSLLPDGVQLSSGPGCPVCVTSNHDIDKVIALARVPGVSTIIGAEPYRFLAREYGIPGVITGFEPNDILQGIAMIVRQLREGRAEVEIAYARGVMPEGNPVALAAIDEVFETCTVTWRGLGPIEGSGYRLRDAFATFDAMRRFDPEVEPTVEHAGCRCGDVLRAHMRPDECPLFRTVCTPENPVGPCMVSSEGSCAAYFRYY